MAKNYLEISDNIIDKMLYKRAGLIGARFFDASNEINKFQQEMIAFYANNFTSGNFEMAKAIIQHKNDIQRTEDVATNFFYFGILVLLIPINCFLIFTRDPATLNPEIADI